jgi:hypothetical protein
MRKLKPSFKLALSISDDLYQLCPEDREIDAAIRRVQRLIARKLSPAMELAVDCGLFKRNKNDRS